MSRSIIATIVVAALAATASAQTLNERLKEGYRQLDAGAAEKALAAFQDAGIDAPESDVVDYTIAHARYNRALSALSGDAMPAAIEDLEAARSAFRELETSSDPFVRENARFNAANSAAQIAKASMASGEQEQTIAMFEEAISAYDDVLRQNPNHEEARRNLDHMRYLLKRMLQNPPEQQEEEQQQEGEENSEGEQEKDEQGEEGEGEQSENEQQGQEGQSESEQQENQDPSGGENDADADEASGGEEENAEQDQEQNRQNIEAILQSLEDQDRQEQKDLRKSKAQPRIRNGKWW